MSNFKNVFNKKAFIAFVTAGDPDLESTEIFIDKMIEAGTALIEIGIPFSDPIAEGSVITKADIRALASNTTTDKIFDMISNVRKKHPDFPLVFMTYVNPVFSYGYDRFFKRAQELNMLGIIIPDLPFEEKEEAAKVAKKYNQEVISLIAPTSDDRIKKIASDSNGFIYLVSSMGVTGMRSEFKTDLDKIVSEIRKYTDTPVAIGFGISNPEQAKTMAAKSDGVIIGSAIVRIIEQYGKNAGPYVYDFCKSIVDAIN
ncbi:MAG: tryptophan synthase subunit alpha [Acholeplasmatales bacterium]|jgi:tryptophan synthase alpha chain|nr:tryptophan synthase subunit alpha [Acholeplasmatales bacterium]MBQ6783903.1 tryptophan synthase subunit alpha [Acholeplasmatales bacterium]